MASGWAYVGCADFATGSGPTGSVQFHTADTSISGSSVFMFHTASYGGLAASTLVLTGTLIVSGSITASNYTIKDITMIDGTGSTRFGNSSDDTHQFTGSVLVNGPLITNGSAGAHVVFNEAGLDIDFRVESEDETHMIFVEGSSNRVSIGDSVDSPTATLEVTNHASAGAFGVPLLQLNSNDVDKIGVDINAANTTANVVDIAATALTTGNALYINHDDTATTAVTPTTIHVDFDKAGVVADGETSSWIGLQLDMADGATNHANSNVTMTGIDLHVDSNSTQGTNENVGIDIIVTDATTNHGIRITAEDGAGSDITMASSADPADYCTIAVAGSGATTLTTVDGGAAAANLTFTVDGTITQTAAGLIKLDGGGVEIENGSTTGEAALLIDNDDTDQVALHIEAANITNNVVDIDADALTTYNVIDVTADGLTTGKILNLVSDSSNTDANTLALIHNDNASAVATTVLHVLNDAIAGSNTAVIETTAAETNPLLELKNSNPATDKPVILSLNRSDSSAEADDMSIGTIRFDGVDDGGQATSYVSLDAIASDVTATDEGGKLTFNVFAGGTAGTAGATNLLSIGGEDATNGTACEVVVNDAGIDCDFRVETTNMSNALFVDAGTEAVQIGASSGTPGGVLEINQYANGHGPSGLPALLVTAADVDQIAVDINASQTTANVIDVAATALTTGKALFIDAGNATTASTNAGGIVHIDFDKAGIVASGQTSTFIGLDLDMDDAATNVGTSTMTGMDLDVISSNAGGTVSNIGLDVSVAGADTNYAALFRSGSVGIGTGAPSKKLHVSGTQANASILVANDGHAIELYPTNGPKIMLGTPGTTYSHQIFGSYSGMHQIQLVSSLDFQISGALGGVGYYFKQSTGFVGLGTSSPTAPLAVNGAAHVTGSILPGADNTHDLGSSDMRWANVYTGDLHLANERGDWTVVEEEDYLTIKNNKTGKRFKLLMEEIE